MSRSQPELRIVRLSDLEPGQTGDAFALLAKKDRGQTRDAKPFYRAAFRDANRTVTVMIWLDGGWFEDCEHHWRVGDYYKLRGRYYENQFGSQLELEKIRPVEAADSSAGFDPAEFQPSSRFDPDVMFAELLALAEQHISDLPLRELTQGLLVDHSEALSTMAAAAYHHHAYRGGYLEHVLSVTRTAVYLADKYREQYPDLQPPLSKSLVVAGAILHDIGKLIELDHRPSGSEYTPAGRLIGHLVLGRDLIRAKAAEIAEFDAEILLRLEHILVSHQGLPEWGSPIPPSTPECLLVHFADDIDAKFQMMAAALGSEPGAAEVEFTSRDNPLKRRIFRGLSAED
ncbi:MAG: nucleotide-binding protein [Planctomycetales bacterium 12-60-4]|nr:MAG: nucleotide-binding protein [Planctomycetales bacterium 12-60-4]